MKLHGISQSWNCWCLNVFVHALFIHWLFHSYIDSVVYSFIPAILSIDGSPPISGFVFTGEEATENKQINASKENPEIEFLIVILH